MMPDDLYPSMPPELLPYKIHTIYLPSPLSDAPPTPIATLLPETLSLSLSSPNTLPAHATPYPSDPYYEILHTPSKGFGMFAKRLIKPGQLILDEHPVLIVPERPLPHDSPAWDSLGRDLPEKERTEMLTMANCRPEEECPSLVEGVVRTNALVLDLSPPPSADDKRKGKSKAKENIDEVHNHQRFGGVFLKINRCNHSCGPNAAHKWDVSNLSSKLYALRAIEPGEEITIFYTDVTQPRDVRRAELEKNHRFLCACAHCLPTRVEESQSRTLIEESDDIRQQLRHWLSTRPSYPKWSTDLCRTDDTVTSSHILALSLIDKENMHFLQHVFLEELALCYAILGDEDQFRFWAGEFMQKCGIEDPMRAEVFKSWLKEPRRYKKWGWRQKQRDLQHKRAPSPVYGYSALLS
ncbi:SET domain-containing protein [Macrolepiota fuliginosa MF-IS2]|uniref:SET domain-containing protein n=1 Tax=Macrolepiota fuliginosa MF-IS2 TaxID=1400762 RepID=A0A9P5X129_9AGAR|nr:SET domain-containing protein [Macrolepiota fuliginosa MF-IS2]KAF9442885.1 SET domain-containing protein [Macrolepiota fuliginosa MF-IS2]